MISSWTVSEVRAAEEALMARLPDGALMQRAATGLATRCAELLHDARGGIYGRQVVLLVGAGNNGGDALFAGARLARRGVRVLAIAVRTPHPAGLAALLAAGGSMVSANDVEAALASADLVIDGIVGIGGRGGLRPEAARLARAAAVSGAVVVAVDVPSGVDADTGIVAGEAVHADVTVTFGCLKPGLLVGDGAVMAGLVELVDIGLVDLVESQARARLLTMEDVSGQWPRPLPFDDKYTRGVVGIAAGSERYPGSAVLAVGGALAGPAGYLRYVGDAADAVRARWPETVCTPRYEDAGRVQAWVVGSGLGTDEAAARAVRSILDTDVPVLLDADAITIVAEHPDWLRGRVADTVLTPHDREFARLMGADVGDDRIGAANEAAERCESIVLLKGDRTIIAAPGGVPFVNPAGSPALATAGSGDVLSGLIGSLLAGDVPAHFAAACGAFAHGLAGRHAAAAGPVSASRLVDAVRSAVHTITAGE